MSQSKLANAITRRIDTGNFKNGVDCNFFDLAPKIGLKQQRHPGVGGFNNNVWGYIVQRALARMGLAPQTFGYCTVDKVFAYFTEKVQIWRDFRDVDSWPNLQTYRKHHKTVDDFTYRFQTGNGIGGFYGSDMHASNIGFNRNFDGSITPLCIDVAYFSLSEGGWHAHNLNDKNHPYHDEYVAIRDNHNLAKEYSPRVCGFHQMSLPCREFVNV